MSFVFDWPADVSRETQVERIWRAFGYEMEATVQAILDGSRPPSEIALVVGEVVGNYFRARGLALTEAELHQLVAELHRRHQPASPLVAFARVPDGPWTGGEATQNSLGSPNWIFDEAPSGLVRFAPGRRQGPAPVELQWAD